MKESKHYDWVDVLKGIAILGVVLIHSGGAHLPGVFGKIGVSGLYGVQLFFMLSSFLLWNSLENSGKQRYREYFKKKLFRLLPEYYICYILTNILLSRDISFFDILAHLSGVWGFIPVYHNNTMAEWYLGALIIFIAFAPALYRVIDTFEKSVVFFVASLFFTLLYQAIIENYFPNINEDYSLSSYFFNTSIWAQLPSVSLGIILFYVVKYIEQMKVS